MDLIEEEIRREAEKYRQVQVNKEGSIKSKLTSPIKWFKQLGVKNSYKFVNELPPTAAQQQRATATAM